MSRARVPQVTTAAGAPRRRLLSPADNRLVRAVGRLPAGVHTKLLVAFVGTALLVIVLGVLGLRLLGQANERVETLGTLQQRAFAYGKLQADASYIRLLQAQHVGGDFYKNFPDLNRTEDDATGQAIDGAIASAVALIPASTFPDNLLFRPPPEDEIYLQRIRSTGERLSSVVRELIKAREAGSPRETSLRVRSEALAIDLNQGATELANVTAAKTDALTAQNASAYSRSRNLFIAAAAGTIVLALFLGFVLSWSLVGPIQRIDSRLAAIASGNFSGQVDVANRDELGALAANVNRMNDELQRLYRELETASRHKSEFLANMSHELRTPLNAIIGFSQVLREGLFGEVNAKQEEYLEDILTSGNHLLALINDVLDLSKVEAGQLQLELAPFSIGDALERGVSMVREQATRNGVQCDAPRQRWPRHRHRGRAADQTGRLQPPLQRREVHARRRVGRRQRHAGERRGEGLRRGQRPRHRGRRSRADLRGVPADRRRGEAARRDRSRARPVEALRRDAWGPHLVRQRGRQGKHLRVHRARGSGRAMTDLQVLVVEDNERNMRLFRDVLEAAGHRTLAATTGERAVELAGEHRPDLVLMDIQLPGIDGVEALGRLRSDERTRAVPVLALTAQAMEGDRERFLEAGFDGYLSKPVNIADLVDAVRRYGRRDTR